MMNSQKTGVKKGLQKLFTEVSDRYEIVNHILTFGLDRYWRKRAAKEAAQAGGSLWLDICSGTGEMAYILSSLAGDKTKIVTVDFCLPMISKGIKKRPSTRIIPTLADAGTLPFKDRTFDLITISFATRNINSQKRRLIHYLEEFQRVLKPGGMFVNLETSQPSDRILRKLFHFYAKHVVKTVGKWISGSEKGYRYLSSTIPRFYFPDELSFILRKAGFSPVSFRSLLFGISAIHTAVKIN